MLPSSLFSCISLTFFFSQKHLVQGLSCVTGCGVRLEALFSPLTPIQRGAWGQGFILSGARAQKWWYRHLAGWSLNPDWCSHLKLKAAPFYVSCFSALTSLWCNFCFRCSLPSWVRLVWNWPGSSRDCSVKLQVLGPYWKSLTHIRGRKVAALLGSVWVGGWGGGWGIGQEGEECMLARGGWGSWDSSPFIDCWRSAHLNLGAREEE